MLSRTADSLYWLARYVERAEYIARTIDATLRVTALPAAYIGKTNEWESALLTAGVSEEPAEPGLRLALIDHYLRMTKQPKLQDIPAAKTNPK